MSLGRVSPIERKALHPRPRSQRWTFARESTHQSHMASHIAWLGETHRRTAIGIDPETTDIRRNHRHTTRNRLEKSVAGASASKRQDGDGGLAIERTQRVIADPSMDPHGVRARPIRESRRRTHDVEDEAIGCKIGHHRTEKLEVSQMRPDRNTPARRSQSSRRWTPVI